jgi:thiol-disulfide isomerase/thioredoxin
MLNIKYWKHITIIILIIIICYLYYYNNLSNGTPSNVSVDGYEQVSYDEKNIIDKTVGKQITNKLQNKIILYYASWCGYSKSFLPIWDKFVEYANKNIPDLDVQTKRCEDGTEAECMQDGVEGYPTVILILNDGTKIPFESDRTSEKLIEFVTKHL